jgi:hypothetical protein
MAVPGTDGTILQFFKRFKKPAGLHQGMLFLFIFEGLSADRSDGNRLTKLSFSAE